jgi:hypothetical protein
MRSNDWPASENDGELFNGTNTTDLNRKYRPCSLRGSI